MGVGVTLASPPSLCKSQPYSHHHPITDVRGVAVVVIFVRGVSVSSLSFYFKVISPHSPSPSQLFTTLLSPAGGCVCLIYLFIKIPFLFKFLYLNINLISFFCAILIINSFRLFCRDGTGDNAKHSLSSSLHLSSISTSSHIMTHQQLANHHHHPPSANREDYWFIFLPQWTIHRTTIYSPLITQHHGLPYHHYIHNNIQQHLPALNCICMNGKLHLHLSSRMWIYLPFACYPLPSPPPSVAYLALFLSLLPSPFLPCLRLPPLSSTSSHLSVNFCSLTLSVPMPPSPRNTPPRISPLLVAIPARLPSRLPSSLLPSCILHPHTQLIFSTLTSPLLADTSMLPTSHRIICSVH